MANQTFITFITFSRINSFAYINSILFTAFIISNLQKDFHQDNLSLVYLHFYKDNCLNILEGNTCCHIQVKNH